MIHSVFSLSSPSVSLSLTVFSLIPSLSHHSGSMPLTFSVVVPVFHSRYFSLNFVFNKICAGTFDECS